MRSALILTILKVANARVMECPTVKAVTRDEYFFPVGGLV